MKYMVIGCGYVGLSIATLLAKKNIVYLCDVDSNKLGMIKDKTVPYRDDSLAKEFEDFFDKLNFRFEKSFHKSVQAVDIIIIAVPTDSIDGNLNTKIVDRVIDNINNSDKRDNLRILIKSTLPIGHTKKLRARYNKLSIFYLPEFLRERNAFQDIKKPFRIVVGGEFERTNDIIDEYVDCLEVKCPVFYMNSDEAEAVKLFSNTYLAMRIAFFNELDLFAEKRNLNPYKIIIAVCNDPRIGEYYNNPSFGYGGYCLPKDTLQLAGQFEDKDAPLIQHIHESNEHRKQEIVLSLVNNYKKIGIYCSEDDYQNGRFKNNVLYDIIKSLVTEGVDVYIKNDSINEIDSNSIIQVKTIEDLKKSCEIILADRITPQLYSYKHLIYTRDLFYYD